MRRVGSAEMAAGGDDVPAYRGPVLLEVTFPKLRDPRRVATFAWSDGFVATCPIWGRCERLPHDLEHYAVDAHFRPPYAFWTLVGQQAPFDSLTPVRGRWPARRVEWLDRIRRKHGADMLKGESPGLGRVVGRPDFDADADWPAIRRSLDRAYVFGTHNPFAKVTKESLVALHDSCRSLVRTWEQVPLGGAVVVHWPPDRPPEIVTDVHERAARGVPKPAGARR